MKKILFLFLALFCLLPINAQSNCISSVKDAIAKWKHKQFPLKIKNNERGSFFSNYFQNISKEEIETLINKAEVFCYGNPTASVVLLNLGNHALYFEISTEPPVSSNSDDVLGIYDETGHSILYNDESISFPAIINDPDGYVNIREKPSLNSKIKGKIRKNQIFFYFPIWGTKWCKIYLRWGGPCVGYIYKDRILPYEKCPPKIQEKMEHLVFC